jgi:hypothetical protein
MNAPPPFKRAPAGAPPLSDRADLLRRLLGLSGEQDCPVEADAPDEEPDAAWSLPAHLAPLPAGRLGLSKMDGAGGVTARAEARLVRSKVLDPLGLEMCRLLVWEDEQGEHWVVEPGEHWERGSSHGKEVLRERLQKAFLQEGGASEVTQRAEALRRWAALPWGDLCWD